MISLDSFIYCGISCLDSCKCCGISGLLHCGICGLLHLLWYTDLDSCTCCAISGLLHLLFVVYVWTLTCAVISYIFCDMSGLLHRKCVSLNPCTCRGVFILLHLLIVLYLWTLRSRCGISHLPWYIWTPAIAVVSLNSCICCGI